MFAVYKNNKDSDGIITKIEEQGFKLSPKENSSIFIGVDIYQQDDSIIGLNQDKLIYHINYEVGFHNAKPKNKIAKI